ncbi:alpha/beta hydrolase [Microbacterium panaciterrae]|uniref:Alpha/beta hydrolase-fold protein n=1 Tax=Microbacterium panaciterrae TaxID=985759 RepID=A0ABP8PAQ2_9MICO
MTWFYKLSVIDGPLPLTVWGLTIVGVIVLLIRRPTPAWLWRIVIALAVGIGGGVAAVAVANATAAFGPALPSACWLWVPAGFGATLLGIVSLWERGVWRKIVAVLLVILALLSTTLGVNAAFGINPTVGALLGASAQDDIHTLPTPGPTQTASGPLYKTWNPPADMPAHGTVGQLAGDKAIRSTAGFVPRSATVYLPPAAQVKNPPRLPLVVMMMGFPGSPDPTFIATALDALAAKNKGLAPIVIVADQLGSESQDPVCVDSQKYGGVSTYFNTDIPAYATKNLNVLLDHSAWTIMGYSNGGACAFTWATHHPDIWGNVIGISPDEYPGVEWRAEATRTLFDGDAAAFEANMPAAGVAAHPGAFTGHLAVFTVGGNDPGFIPGAQRNTTLAEEAGFTTTFHVVPGADHVVSALNGGIPFAMDLLYKHLGLSAP